MSYCGRLLKVALLSCALTPSSSIDAQANKPHVVPVPPLRSQAPVKEPTDPPAREVRDPRGHLTLHLPPGWNLALKDGEISTYRLDARTAPRRSQLHLAASLGFNPFPQSTFEGAIFYVSSIPTPSAAACAAQTTLPPARSLDAARIDGVKFSRGRDEHGRICTESRDVIYAAEVRGECLRFDLAINSFCGGEISGAQDLTEPQLGSLFSRLQEIVNSVHLTK